MRFQADKNGNCEKTVSEFAKSECECVLKKEIRFWQYTFLKKKHYLDGKYLYEYNGVFFA